MSSPEFGDLANERALLVEADECLVRMRRDAEAIGDAGSDAWTSEVLGGYRARRLAALKSDSNVPPFFAALSFEAYDDYPPETFHIGRRHIRDAAGDPVVIDWRAPMAEAFYQASADDRRHVIGRRRFGFHGGVLTSFEDETLAVEENPLDSALLIEEIERPRVGPMRDIVATIQPDQDDIVRARYDVDVCVQGAPGTGKTAVGLHRAAYLLYTYADQLRRSRVLIVGPNQAFLSYIGAVLPALGEFDVDQTMIESLTDRVPVSVIESPEVGRLKGDARMSTVIANALKRLIRKPTDSLQVTLGDRKYRLDETVLKRYVDDARRSDIPYLAGRERVALSIGEHARREREYAGGAPTDAAVRRTAKSKEVVAFLDQVWPAVTADKLIFALLSDRSTLHRAAAGILTDVEMDLLVWRPPPRSVGRAAWSVADGVLVDEAAGLLERTSSYGHVILDEAQDLSPMQCRAVARRCVTGSLTVLGDIAQGTSDWASRSWSESLAHLGRPAARVEELTLGYRVPGEIIDFANQYLPLIAPTLTPARSVRPGRGSLRFHPVADLLQALPDIARAADQIEGTIGVICRDDAVDEVLATLLAAGLTVGVIGAEETNRWDVVPASLAKGLEFDHVLLLEPAEIVAAERRGLARLYVCLTRAVSSMDLIHVAALPAGSTA